MTGLLKDDLTVALDDVDRRASGIVTICENLAAIAVEPDIAVRLRERGERQRTALVGFNQARLATGQTPEVADPERAHLQSLWMALKSAVSGEASRERLEESLEALDAELRAAATHARSLGPEPEVREALDRLTSTQTD